jgi:hypothetical protein
MFEMSDRFSPVLPESADEAYDNNRSHNINRVIPQMTDGGKEKIFLPPRSRFAPPSYYYLASKSGVIPSWVIDELQSRNRGGHLNS